MKILMLHQNMPGQFKYLAPALARAGNEVVFITKQKTVEIPGVRKIIYEPHRQVRAGTHHYMRLFENSILHGQQVARMCQQLAAERFFPDVVVAHPGWGESLFIKDVFPRSPLINYCEFYYQGSGADIGFDPEKPVGLDDLCRARARNAHLLLSLEACDRGWSPTEWQKSRHPGELQHKISTVFDGIDIKTVKPDPEARFALPDGRELTAKDEVITYVARNLEPYRGFPTFMRALPRLLKERPKAQVVIVGGDSVSYGASPTEGGNWREVMLKEVTLPEGRVHFMGQVPYAKYVSLLQISSAHVYLTYPFVLSWSFMEAMAAGCLIVASDTAPVREVLKHGENGYFTDFFDPDKVVDSVVMALKDKHSGRLREAARASVVGKYDLASCLPRQLGMIEAVAGKPVVVKPPQQQPAAE
ncbi:glycosyltransferase family 4 protein [Asticcacaulis solisilvae]|uniref:glycosyltransferase family 4 protein n=1 Tax=Asticcacaulis solisilvae TaxID=1217274 RepID=UPI003FD7C6BF